MSHLFRPIPTEELISASARHVSWKTEGFIRLLTDARNSGTVPAIVHTHPGGVAAFSDQDDENEAKLARTVTLKGLPGLISLVVGGDGQIAARFWFDQSRFELIDEVSEIGARLRFRQTPGASAVTQDALDRQARLFGDDFNRILSGLRIGIVGAGATGSAVNCLLTRLGVGHLLMVDRDRLEATNLNRVHGTGRSDVGTQKVKLAERETIRAGLGVEFIGLEAWCGEPETRDALKSCDVIFGCTDDHSGRLFLNRLATYYGIPLIDVGLRMRNRGGERVDVTGRVSTLVTGHQCLLCQGVVDPKIAGEDALRQRDPEAYARLKDEAYIKGGGDPAPAVVTFTTEMACVAVNSLIDALTGYQGGQGMVARRIRRFHQNDDRVIEGATPMHCPLCGTGENRGLADQIPFLGMVR
ncbi:ThiF family adenylyltransferase [Hyphomonas sp.]|uniref:ThiF family adenylyltransferase n=1 Tax=Hyphomonas sp. TaxID=87 RepID=UPI00345D6957